MKDYDYISNPEADNSHSILVPEHSDETRMRAAQALADQFFDPAAGHLVVPAVQQLASKAQAVTFTQHAVEPTDDDGCGCEAKGWWCESPSNGGETRDFWHFEWDDIEDAREVAEAFPPEDEGPDPAQAACTCDKRGVECDEHPSTPPRKP